MSAADTPLRFAGQYADDETGLYYNHRRYYDPVTARYLSQDPLGLAPAPNPNSYVVNPTAWMDPSGLSPCHPIGFAEGEGVTALTNRRLQHASRHLIDRGLLSPWSGKNSPKEIRDALVPILERPSATFDHQLQGGQRVKGFTGQINGQDVFVMVFKEGKYAGEVATADTISPNQALNWGLT